MIFCYKVKASVLINSCGNNEMSISTPLFYVVMIKILKMAKCQDFPILKPGKLCAQHRLELLLFIWVDIWECVFNIFNFL